MRAVFALGTGIGPARRRVAWAGSNPARRTGHVGRCRHSREDTIGQHLAYAQNGDPQPGSRPPPDRRGRARTRDARRQRPARSARAQDGAGGARRLVVRRLRHLPLGSPPGQPGGAADDDRRNALASRADDGPHPTTRHVHRGKLAVGPLGRGVRYVPVVVSDRPPQRSSRPRDRRNLPVRVGAARVRLDAVLGAREWPECFGHRARRRRRPCRRHAAAGPDLAGCRTPRDFAQVGAGCAPAARFGARWRPSSWAP